MRYRHPFSVAVLAAIIVLQFAPTLTLAAAPSANRGYLGKPRDPGFGFQDLGHRWYDPSTQRFLSPDPVFWEVGRGTPDSLEALHDSQMQNPFSYASGNPLRFLDPEGRKKSEHQDRGPKNGKIPTIGELMATYRGMPLYSNGELAGSGNGPSEAQCVDSVKRFYRREFGISIGTVVKAVNMADLTAGYPLERHPQGGDTMPAENDIIVWKGGRYGHTGIVAEVEFNASTGTGKVWTVEQNRSRGQSLFSNKLTKDPKKNTYTIEGFGGYEVMSWQRPIGRTPPPLTQLQPSPATSAPAPAQGATAPMPPKSSENLISRGWQWLRSHFRR